jgi:SAM-dependent methyltransferase
MVDQRRPGLVRSGFDMHGHQKKVRFILDRLHALAARRSASPDEIRVLDLGCGNGELVSRPVAQAGFHLLGIDAHGPSVEWARTHVGSPNARFEVGDVATFGAEAVYAAVILSDILEHVEDPRAVLARARDALADDGIILVSIPNGYGPFEIEQWLVRVGVLRPLVAMTRRGFAFGARLRRRIKGLPWPPPDSPHAAYNAESGHVQHFSRKRFARLVSSCGLVMQTQSNGAFAGGDLTYFVFYAAPRLASWSLRFADLLPPGLVSTWYFELRVSPGGPAYLNGRPSRNQSS